MVAYAYMLYTRAGDGGTTRTFGCTGRVSKASAVAEALGTLDELTSYLGLCRAELAGSYRMPPGTARARKIVDVVEDLQETLFTIQAEVAGAGKRVARAKVRWLEAATDSIEHVLPPIRSFTVPGASRSGALLDVARTIARRAERRVIAAHEAGTPVRAPTLAYLNRLSSLLFALARYLAHLDGATEHAPRYR